MRSKASSTTQIKRLNQYFSMISRFTSIRGGEQYGSSESGDQKTSGSIQVGRSKLAARAVVVNMDGNDSLWRGGSRSARQDNE
jgi:hypothetical protein